MARRRRRRPPGGQTTAAGSGRRRAPFSTDNLSHTHTARSLACPLLTLSSPARSFPNGIFRYDGAPCGRPLLPCSDRSAGQRNQPSHSTVLARPVRLFVCVSAASFPCARPLLPSSDRSAGQRNQPSDSDIVFIHMHTTPGTHDALGALRTRRLSGNTRLRSPKSYVKGSRTLSHHTCSLVGTAYLTLYKTHSSN